jgi:F0F1-type ATP synthase assembly protein I
MSDESGADGRGSGKDGSPKAGEHSPWALAGLGVQFFAALILFVYAGSWLDDRFGLSPLFLLLGLFVGGGGSFYLSYRRLMAPRDGG